MNSMTGFGRAELNSKLGRFTIEVSSVNNRFLESVARLPRNLSALEPQVRKMVTGSIKRGKVNVFIGLSEPEGANSDTTINSNSLKAYYRELKKLQKELGLKGEVTISELLMFPDVVSQKRSELDPEEVWSMLKKSIGKAMKQMLSMRAREGKALAVDMRQRLKAMNSLMREIDNATTDAVKKYRQKLAARVDELLNGQKHDPARLEEEITIFAERTDITEECIRFKSHLDQFKITLGQKDAVGRRLNFILQEMNREVNTIGSKGAHFDISSKVISLKEEIEKLREQVQNVE